MGESKTCIRLEEHDDVFKRNISYENVMFISRVNSYECETYANGTVFLPIEGSTELVRQSKI